MMHETRFPVSPKERQVARQVAAYRGWEKRRERDEAVTVNLPADMLPLWEKMKSQFKGSPDARREAFLQYAHDQGDGAVIEALIDASEARLAGMLHEYRSRFASEAVDADTGTGDVDAGAEVGAGVAYEASFAGWLDEVGIGTGEAGDVDAGDAGAGARDAGAGARDAGAGAGAGAVDADADEVTAVMARPALAAALAGVQVGAVTLFDFDEVTAVMARPSYAADPLDCVIVLGADDADVTIVDAV